MEIGLFISLKLFIRFLNNEMFLMRNIELETGGGIFIYLIVERMYIVVFLLDFKLDNNLSILILGHIHHNVKLNFSQLGKQTFKEYAFIFTVWNKGTTIHLGYCRGEG